ncbi:hypothetical protein M422DRAFT_199301 [Sphaerobolus stellatus SS14]|nr:hypothetical protein M422DRAFT_199301 [Sphaerobolus stellatus SS14]
MHGEDELEIIETSDNDERELLASNHPDYYRNVWGKNIHEIDIADDEIAVNSTLLRTSAKEPHAPIPDPSPGFTRLSISGMSSPNISKRKTTVDSRRSPIFQPRGGTTELSQGLGPIVTPIASRNHPTRISRVSPSQSRNAPSSSPDPLALHSPISKGVDITQSLEVALSPLADLRRTRTSGLEDPSPSHISSKIFPTIYHNDVNNDTLSTSPPRSPTRSTTVSTKIATSSRGSTDPVQSQDSILPPSQPSFSLANYENKHSFGMDVDDEPGDFMPFDMPSQSRHPTPPPQWQAMVESPQPTSPPAPTSGFFRSESPLTPPPPSPGASHRHRPLQVAEDQVAEDDAIEIPPDSEVPIRKYSLRNRNAQQLHPFEYDKRQYRRLMRHNPEAIVKSLTASSGYSHSHTKEGYEGGEDDDEGEFGEDEGEDEGEKWRKREAMKEKRREQQRRKERVEELKEKLGIREPTPDEDDEILENIALSTGNNRESGPRGKKRKRTYMMKDFPVLVQPEITASTSSKRASADIPVNVAPKPRPRPRPIPQKPAKSPAPTDAVQPEYDYNLACEDDNGDWDGMEDRREKSPALWRSNEEHTGAVDVQESPPREHARPNRRAVTSSTSDSDVQIVENRDVANDRSDSEGSSEEGVHEEDDEAEKARRAMKVLGRMMPKVLMNKIMRGEYQDQTKKKVTNSAEPSRPGHGRKRIISPGRCDPKRYEIRGDSESESDGQAQNQEMSVHQSKRTVSPGSRTSEWHRSIARIRPRKDNINGVASDQDVIVIDSDSEDSEDGLDADDIHTWLAPPTNDDAASIPEVQEIYKQRQIGSAGGGNDRLRDGDLVDRMLQRTRRVGPRRKEAKKSRKMKSSSVNARPSSSGTRNGIGTGRQRHYGTKGLRQARLHFPSEKERPAEDSRRQHKPRDNNTGGVSRKSRGHIESTDHESHDNIPAATKAKAKTKQKRRKHKPNGVIYFSRNEGRLVTTGRQKDYIHIDLDDEELNDALAATNAVPLPKPSARNHDLARNRKAVSERVLEYLRNCQAAEQDDFDENPGNPGRRQFLPEFDPLPSGIATSPEGYIRKGRLFDLIEFLKGNGQIQKPSALILPNISLYPSTSGEEIGAAVASALDSLYRALNMEEDLLERKSEKELHEIWKSTGPIMHSLRQILPYKVSSVTQPEANQIATGVFEQLKRLIKRIEDQKKLLDNLDYRIFALYWLAVELHLRISYVLMRTFNDETARRPSVLEDGMVKLIRRLLEYGFDRVVGPLRNEGLEFHAKPQDILEYWICILHVAPFCQGAESSTITNFSFPFWKLVDRAMSGQSNMPDRQLHRGERIWETIFSLCTISQFSAEGYSSSMIRLGAYWAFVKQGLGCIQLSADSLRDNGKDSTTLRNRDHYLRLITARCFVLSARWNWDLNDADDVFQELCSIFRSRQFSNLLGEPNDFPEFISKRQMAVIDRYEDTETAYGIFLKLVIRAAKGYMKFDETGRRQTVKLTRLLSLVVPVGSTSFSKTVPPLGQDLSMLYNRYSAVIVGIYVDATEKRFQSLLNQARRYITFKDADFDSRNAAIRAMSLLAILMRDISKPLDDILRWISEMISDSVAELSEVSHSPAERNEVILTTILLLGSLRSIIEPSSLITVENALETYPDVRFLQVWMAPLLSSQFAKDHRTGEAMCKCIHSFIEARSRVIRPAPPVKPQVIQVGPDSTEEYGDFGFDLEDPNFQTLLDKVDDPLIQYRILDQKASEVLDFFSQSLYTCLCMHLGCEKIIEPRRGPYYEAELWLESWVGLGDILVRHKKRTWTYYFQLLQSASNDLSDPFRRSHIRIVFMLYLLRVDPTVYESFQDHAVSLWFATVAVPDVDVTLQDQFTAQLFNADSLHHMLLRDMPCTVEAASGRFHFNLDGFLQERIRLIERAIENAAAAIVLTRDNRFISFVETLLLSMKQYNEALSHKKAERRGYMEFIEKIHSLIRDQQALWQHPNIQKHF